MNDKQRGITILSFLFGAAILGFCAILVARIVPVYVEYYQIKKNLTGAMHDAKEPTLNDIRRGFAARLAIDYIKAVKPEDIEVYREGGQVIARIQYQDKVVLLQNISLLFDFDVEAKK